MKRLIWLLILVFGTAVSQVRAVDVRLTAEEKCCCCADGANACDMASDCAPAPTSCAAPCLTLQAPAQAATKRTAPAPQAAHEKFYAQFLSPARIAPVLPVVEVAAPAASVPLFRAHCSFLI
jgi:hypothetical protein